MIRYFAKLANLCTQRGPHSIHVLVNYNIIQYNILIHGLKVTWYKNILPPRSPLARILIVRTGVG